MKYDESAPIDSNLVGNYTLFPSVTTNYLLPSHTDMSKHICSTLFKTQERESDRSKEIEQRKESQNTHKQNESTEVQTLGVIRMQL